jgi:hypothetical protein
MTASGATAAAKEGGKHSVLLRIKSREGTRYVALTVSNAQLGMGA